MNARRRGADAMAIIGLGLCTPLGLTARATQVEMAAGTVRFFETEVLDSAGEPIRASVLPLLEPELTRTERMAALAVTALQEALKGTASLGIERLPLLLALPEAGSGASFDLKALLKALNDASGPVRLESSESTLISEGRAGFFRALTEASRFLSSRKASWVLVGGVDSMCDRDSLAHHAHMGRSLGPSTRDGTLPGEGAGFLLLASPLTQGQRGLAPLGWIVGYSLSHEPHCFLQRKPNLAEGLSDAFRQLRTHPVVGARRVDHVLSCQTGENFWAQEFNYSYLRNAPLMPEPLTMALIAASLGDVGAAAGPIQAGSALHHLKRQAPAEEDPTRVLVYGCADAGQVGACVIEGDS
ncbi:MAG: 3-oxoacyl-ACP synthase [Hyalangium sp.]|uniref:3-oxoacyl-ACP synthase n=1 Tax=Hyalangium sp. TaxID=2028555 RepID=UPI0038998B49